MSSSWKNAVKRKTHKERAQPKARAKWGLLEKKKDYKRRAKAHHERQAELQALRRKAALRNPDEFYFGMHSRSTKAGLVDQDGGDTPLDNDTARVLKTQDLAYLNMKKAADVKKVERLRSTLHLLGNSGPASAGGAGAG
eukprot:CAMPEP_0113937452 /NCGR_PEP_ID=MMETSP1339-20121228/4078_1 /TAXON_ID=94617 /ORGANISM="Fibrocapsa japonica" /LENGTH=138 /DNA_ID=CAMNT_0000940223 /DNA_START=30 /DNA_END=442 /DNA_ORIENTATION=- /assembly_acc=CAM_ASM_000762